MKKVLTIILFFLACNVHAQNWQEWTQQKKTQLKYLVNQIIALQTYATYVEKGYAIASNGLQAIHNIKKGDLAMHEAYFNSLKAVNPKIESYWKVAEIITLQIKIVKACHSQRDLVSANALFSVGEKDYCNNVFTNLLNGSVEVIDELIDLVADGNAAMKDDERIGRINKLHEDILNKYEFVLHFDNETNMLALQKAQEANDIQTSKALLNIGN